MILTIQVKAAHVFGGRGVTVLLDKQMDYVYTFL